MKKEWIALSPSARYGGRDRRPWAVVDHVDAQQGHTARGRSRGRTRCEGRGYVAVTRARDMVRYQMQYNANER